MKPQHLFYYLVIIAVLFTACSKVSSKDKDYRDKYVGVYDFTTIDCIGICDTIHFTGTIEKYKTSRLKIIFKPNATEPTFAFPIPINGLMYPIVDNTGTIIYPEFIIRGYQLSGLITDNEISVFYDIVGGQTIYGVKLN